jgi:hypothetical protein
MDERLFSRTVTKSNAGVMGALIRMANCRLGFTVLESSEKGLAFQGRPSLFSTLRSAHYDYRQQASICWQHSMRSPQQSVAANANTEVVISAEPNKTLKNLDRMLNSLKRRNG